VPPTESAPDVYARARPGLLTRVAGRFAARARRRRYDLYRQAIGPVPGETVVDIGCGPAGLGAFEAESRITGVDLTERPEYAGANRTFVRADARALPFADREFDIAYSNSLVEHLQPADRSRFAAEARRVAGRYFVQTPSKWFPIEPHVLLPLFQFLPLRLRRLLWPLGVWQGPFEDIRLLGARELRGLFPDARIIRERVGPLTKSLIAVGPVERPQDG
jgi:SAM-dependent methyltransferase